MSLLSTHGAIMAGPGTPPQTVLSSVNKASDIILANGDRDAESNSTTGGGVVLSVSGRASGKFYAEFERVGVYSADHTAGIGLHRETSGLTAYLGSTADGWGVYSASLGYGSRTFTNGTASNINTGSGVSTIGQRFRIAADLDNGLLYFAISNRGAGAWIGGGDPASGTSPTYTFSPGGDTFYLAASPLRGGASGNRNRLRLVLPHNWSFSAPVGFGIWT